MRPNPIVVLHGWSDTSQSFVSLAAWLRGRGFNVAPVFLGDYLSMNDEITVEDLGDAFRRALEANGVAQGPHAFDVIVHSTGGLVIREYLRQICAGQPDRTPVQNLLMFSPANFGSPLATLGKSLLGRLTDGWNWDHFGQTGRAILDALELASPYAWDLAMADLFDATWPVYDPARTFVTVVAGTAAYPGFRAALHENGSDGTVRVSTASLNATLLRLNCAGPDPIAAQAVPRSSPPLALAVLDRDHSAIHDPGDPRQTAEWEQIVSDALSLGATDYAAHTARCAQVAQATFAAGLAQAANPERYHQYQTLMVRVRDQFGAPVSDYMLEFYQEAGDAADDVFSALHGDILEKVTTNSVDSSYRSFLLDCTGLTAFLDANPDAQVELSISAAHLSERIVYRNPQRGVMMFTGADRTFVRPNATLMIDFTLYRDPTADVFRVTPAL